MSDHETQEKLQSRLINFFEDSCGLSNAMQCLLQSAQFEEIDKSDTSLRRAGFEDFSS